MNKVVEIPRRFFGPVTADQAVDLADLLMEDARFRHDIEGFMSGEIDPRDFLYRFQVLCETTEERLLRARREEMGLGVYSDAEGEEHA